MLDCPDTWLSSDQTHARQRILGPRMWLVGIREVAIIPRWSVRKLLRENQQQNKESVSQWIWLIWLIELMQRSKTCSSEMFHENLNSVSVLLMTHIFQRMLTNWPRIIECQVTKNKKSVEAEWSSWSGSGAVLALFWAKWEHKQQMFEMTWGHLPKFKQPTDLAKNLLEPTYFTVKQ